MHHHHVEDAGLGSLPLLTNWGQPAAQLPQGSHQRLFLNNNHYLPMMPWLQLPRSHELAIQLHANCCVDARSPSK